MGFAVVETTDDAVILDRKGELLPELAANKRAEGLDLLFLAVVNIVAMRSNLLKSVLPSPRPPGSLMERGRGGGGGGRLVCCACSVHK